MKTFLLSAFFGAALVISTGAVAQEQASATGQDYEPDPAIWLVQDEDTRIYLFGTIHRLPEDFRWRSPRLDRIVTEAEELIVETTDEDIDDLSPHIARLIGSPAKRRLVSERLSPANGKKWLALGEALGMEPGHFDRLPPLLALFTMGSMFDDTGADAAFGVETVLEADFKAAGKPIGSIESAADVLASLLEIDEALIIKDLDRELSRWKGESPDAMFSASGSKAAGNFDEGYSPLAQEHAWARGEEVDVSEELAGTAMYGLLLSKRLLDRRNRAWAAWIERRLETPGTVLIAVGAGHLAGRGSVQAMLAARGLSSERLK
jgi:uncharacterized protein YbaP (TraB family)